MINVDNGGFFPDAEDYRDVAWFLMDAFKVLGLDAVGVSERELRYGRGFLVANYQRSKLPLVCANLIDKSTGKPLVAPYVIKKVGTVTVGVFGLTSDKADLGGQRDSVSVDDPVVTARHMVDELHKKGGLARRASFVDSISVQYGQVVLVDNGFFFPEAEDWEQDAWFLMDAMKLLKTDAVNVSEKELRYGRSFLLANWKRSKLPLVSANLWDKGTKKNLVDPYVLVKKGTVTVGVFGLTSEKVDLGVSRDSLTVEDPAAAAKRVIPEMRRKGATVIVLLSQLGKVESEDLVTAVDGVDVLIVGRNVPVLQKGRLIKNTVACYGGEQGQYVGRTILTLDATRHMSAGDNETAILSPEVGERPDILTLVKTFEDNFNDKLRKKEKERAAQPKSQARERMLGTGH